VRGTRSVPWLADHVIYIGYRWLSWCAIGAWVLAQGRLPDYAPVLVLTGLLNFLSSLGAQPFLRAAQRNPLLLGIDIVYAVLVLVWSGGWSSPFAFYAYSSLIVPGLLDGWRGRIMSGLAFVTIYPALLWAVGRAPSELVSENGWPSFALVMLGPIIFACVVPGLIEIARRAVEHHRATRRRVIAVPRLERTIGSDTGRFSAGGRAPFRGGERLIDQAPLAIQATKIRTTEPSVEELRNVIFSPLPSLDMDLGAALDLLALRFGQHTGTPARLTLLGRTRQVNRIYRDLLVRLAREALLNIQQHAHAGSAMLTLRYDANSVVLLIQDDGVGLLDGTHERPRLHALRAMQYRLAEFGGRLDVFETEGGGLTVRATMPLE
jgi:hypothetical protein